jgi:hypothetical protein
VSENGTDPLGRSPGQQPEQSPDEQSEERPEQTPERGPEQVPDRPPAVDLLAETLSPSLPMVVDELHVAAVLESRGINDSVAGEQYGYDDVFALAAEVTRILLAEERGQEAAQPHRSSVLTLRTLAHGPLYLTPSLAYPAVWTAVGEDMLRGMVTATAIGWIWGMATSSLAYQFRGLERERSAGTAQRGMMLAGIGVALVAALVLTASGLGGPGLTAFVVGQVIFQLAAGVLVFYGQESVLAVTVLPVGVSAVGYLASGRPTLLADLTMGAAVLSCGSLLFVAWRLAGRGSGRGTAASREVRRQAMSGAAPSVVYAALCAVLLLSIDVRYLKDTLDLAMAAAPLVLGMGAVEWRAERFVEQSRVLLAGSSGTREFRRRIWRLAMRELTNCGVILGGLAVVQLLILRQVVTLTLRGATLVDAHVVLGCAFFLGFLLMSRRSFPRILIAVCVVVAVHLVAVHCLAGVLAPHGEVVVFLVTTTVLLLLFLGSFRISLGRAYHSYW